MSRPKDLHVACGAPPTTPRFIQRMPRRRTQETQQQKIRDLQKSSLKIYDACYDDEFGSYCSRAFMVDQPASATTQFSPNRGFKGQQRCNSRVARRLRIEDTTINSQSSESYFSYVLQQSCFLIVPLRMRMAFLSSFAIIIHAGWFPLPPILPSLQTVELLLY